MSRNFNGGTSSINTNKSITTPTLITMMAWIYTRTTGGGGFGRVVTFDNAGAGAAPTTGISIDNPTSPNINFAWRADWTTADGIWNTPNDATTTIKNKWYHIAFTYDGSSTANNPLGYLDGLSVALTNTGVPSGTFVTASNQVIIGNVDSVTRGWDGFIAHVLIYNRILSASEIMDCRNFPGLNKNGLIAFWPLFGNGPIEPDYSGFGNHGSVASAYSANDDPVLNLEYKQSRLDYFTRPYSTLRRPRRRSYNTKAAASVATDTASFAFAGW